MLRIAVMCALVVCVGCQPAPSNTPVEVKRDRGADAQAIRDTLAKFVDVVNSDTFAKASRQDRVGMLRAFYRSDDSYASGESPLFFGPLSEPVTRGVSSHLENTELNFSYLFGQKMTYGLRIEEVQVEVGDDVAVALALTTSGYQAADAKTPYVSPGRSTVVFNRIGDRWLISHEHLELYNPNAQGILSKDQLRAQVERAGG